MKIVINAAYGRFSVSYKAFKLLKELGAEGMDDEPYPGETYADGSIREKEGFMADYFSVMDVPRNDPTLVAVVEKLGREACSEHSNLKVVEIPDDVEWTIEEYDGNEWIAEKHRTWH